jgi:hypothetical protein
MNLINDISTLLSSTAIISFFVLILKVIAYLNKSQIEVLLFSDEQKIIYHIVRFLLLSLVMTFVILYGLELFSSNSIDDYLNRPTDFTRIVIVAGVSGILISYLFYWAIVPVVKEFKGETNRYYFIHEVHGKLYIKKSISKDQVILYREEDSDNHLTFYIIEEKRKLLSQRLFLEIKKENFITLLKRFKSSRAKP